MPRQGQVLKQIQDLGAAAFQSGLFSCGTFAAGFLDDRSADVSGVFHAPAEDDEAEKLVFDLSSMTKALATTPVVLAHTWSKARSVEEPLSAIFSELSLDGLEEASSLKLSDVLRHEAGLPAWRNFYVTCENQNRNAKKTLKMALRERRSDHKNVYSDVGMLLLGELLTTTQQKSMAQLFCEFQENQLSIPRAQQRLGPSWFFYPEECASTGFCALRNRELRGEVHDENAWALRGYAAHTGLFGSACSVANYLRRLASSHIGQRIIRENSNWAAKYPNSDSALGWRTARDSSSESFGEGRGIGHMGFTGTAFWIDPATTAFAVLLTNRVAQARTANMASMKAFRGEMFGLLYACLMATVK